MALVIVGIDDRISFHEQGTWIVFVDWLWIIHSHQKNKMAIELEVICRNCCFSYLCSSYFILEHSK